VSGLRNMSFHTWYVPGFSDPTGWSIDNISDERGSLMSAVTVREKKIEFLELERKV
jgi:hypothetical protein